MNQRIVDMRWETLMIDLEGMGGWAVPDTIKYWAMADRVTVGWGKALSATLAGEPHTAQEVARKIERLVDQGSPVGEEEHAYERLMVVRAFLNLGALIGRGQFTVETPRARYSIR